MNSRKRMLTAVVCASVASMFVAIPAQADRGADTPIPSHAERPGAAPHPPYPFTGPVELSGDRLPLRGPFVTHQVNIDAFGGNIPGDAGNEPSIAVDPTNPNRIAIGWRQFDTIQSNFRQGGWSFSDDAGATWTFPGVVHPTEFSSDPVLSFDRSGKFYYYSLQPNRGPGNWACYLYQSTNGGATWPQDVYAFGGDKAWITVDRTGGIGDGNIYSVWTPNTGASCCGPNRFTRSTDGGLSFEEPVFVPSGTFAGTVDVGPDGAAYVFGVSFNTFAFEATKSVDAQDPEATFSFEPLGEVDLGGSLLLGAGPNPQGLLGQAWIATDHSDGPTRGNVYALCSVFPFFADDPCDVMFARSTDGGHTWSPPMRINDDPTGNGAFQWFGTISVAPNGRIDVFWNDTRNDPTTTFSELYYAHSTDGGLTWSPGRPVSPPFNHFLGYPQQNKLGDYYHSISDDAGANLAYAATFNGEQDVYHLRVDHRPADADADGDLDLVDYASFVNCVTPPQGAAGSGCAPFDQDDDGDVDLVDFGAFQARYTGACVPAIVQQPVDAFACFGGNGTFSVQAEGLDLTYQWHHAWINIPGATGPTLTVESVNVLSAGLYGVTVQGACGVELSENAVLGISPLPQIVSQPQSAETCLGMSAEFQLAATGGTPPLTFQWQLNNQPIPGATEMTLIVESVTPEDLGTYRCEVSDGCSVSVFSQAATLTVPEVAITASSNGGTVCVGGTIFLTVSTAGFPTLQWLKDGEPIPGATQAFLAITNATTEDSGTYSAVATGACNSVTSDGAMIEVIPCFNE